MSGDRPTLGEQIAHLAARINGARRSSIPAPADQPAPLPDASCVTPMPPAAVDQAVERLRLGDQWRDGFTPPPQPAEQPFAVLHVREYRSYVDRIVDELGEIAPQASAFGAQNAVTSMRVALLALRLAVAQTAPYVDPVSGGIWPPDPAEIGGVVAGMGDLFSQLDELTRAVQQQLRQAHAAAARGTIIGPPSSSAPAEVEAVMREMVKVGELIDGCLARADHTGQRLKRLTRHPNRQQ